MSVSKKTHENNLDTETDNSTFVKKQRCCKTHLQGYQGCPMVQLFGHRVQHPKLVTTDEDVHGSGS